MRLVPALLALIAPERCLACGTRAAPPWCAACAAAARRLRLPPGCQRCGTSDEPHGCWPNDVPIATTVIAFRYRGPVRAAVVAAKARGASGAWEGLGRELAAVVALGPPPLDVVTWVPADPARRRDRGLDHAQRLAEPVAARLDVPAVAALLARAGRPDQSSLAPAARRALPVGTFRPAADLRRRRVLVVDDVLTTGATLRAASVALAAAGAARVDAAVLARAGSHSLARPAECREPEGGSSEPTAFTACRDPDYAG